MAYSQLVYYAYHSVAAVFAFGISLTVAVLVARSRWRQHLTWAVPAVVAHGLVFCLSIVYDLHVFAHLGSAAQAFMVAQAFAYPASFVGLYGGWKFYVAVKQSLQAAAGKDLLTQPIGNLEPGAWPPPPRVPM